MNCGCHREKLSEYYFQCKNQTWPRFNKITFLIPIKKGKEQYNIYLFANMTRDYSYKNLDFNLILTTPSGEERIMEYNIEDVSINRENGIELKSDLYLSKAGILSLELENLMPVINLKGISGIGIRLTGQGK